MPRAKIAEEFVMKNPDGSYDYEIIDIGNGKGRNILKFDFYCERFSLASWKYRRMVFFIKRTDVKKQ